MLFVKSIGLYRNVFWHASTALEEKEIKNNFGQRANVRIALDLPELKLIRNLKVEFPKINDYLRIIFISRIDKKKNLSFIIEALRNVKCNYKLDIYGPVTDKKYWDKCKKGLRNIKGEYKGIVEHKNIGEVFKKYDLFFFPTLGENFGHVIFESLASGVPVLCSDRTPWDKLKEHSAGWNISLDYKENFIEKLNSLSAIGEEEYSIFRKGAIEYASCIINDKKNIEDNLKLFEDL